nr:DUF2889 domain-containing protein [Desulfobacterales bacterium]
MEKERIDSQTEQVYEESKTAGSGMRMGKLLYRKKKDIEVHITPEKRFVVKVGHSDEKHRLELVVTFSHPHLSVEDIQCKMERYPHKECITAVSSLRAMVGKRVGPGLMNELRELVGNRGCTHLNNLFQEACYSLVQGQAVFGESELRRLFPGISEEQIFKIFIRFKPDLIDSCVRYADGNDYMKRLENTPLPPGAELLKPVS